MKKRFEMLGWGAKLEERKAQIADMERKERMAHVYDDLGEEVRGIFGAGYSMSHRTATKHNRLGQSVRCA